MIPYNGFILSIFLMLPGAVAPKVQGNACQPMDATFTVSAASDSHGLIDIKAPGDADLKVYLLSPESGTKPVEMSLNNGQLKVARGQYDIILKDLRKKYCTQMHRVTVN